MNGVFSAVTRDLAMQLPQIASAVFAIAVLSAGAQPPAPDVLENLPPLHGEEALRR
jgi:hypothetical protein